MNDNFQDIDSEENVPVRIKRQTMEYILGLKTLFSVADLFSAKAGSTFTSSFLSSSSRRAIEEGAFDVLEDDENE